MSTVNSVTIPAIRKRKRKKGATPIAAITAYDAPSARVAQAAGVDILLVGDSLAMVVLGYEDTLQVTVADIVHHLAAVARTKPEALIVGDMPWLSFHLSNNETVKNAATLIRAGAQCVKIEGGSKRLSAIEAILNAEIPVMGHLGLTPQSVHAMGGFKVQAQEEKAVQEILAEAKELEAVGCFSIILEGVPKEVGKLVTDALSIPTIGIGAGPSTDGQILVFHDAVGLENTFKPKFVRNFGDSFNQQTEALQRYVAAVRESDFPSAEESYRSKESLREIITLYGSET